MKLSGAAGLHDPIGHDALSGSGGCAGQRGQPAPSFEGLPRSSAGRTTNKTHERPYRPAAGSPGISERVTKMREADHPTHATIHCSVCRADTFRDLSDGPAPGVSDYAILHEVWCPFLAAYKKGPSFVKAYMRRNGYPISYTAEGYKSTCKEVPGIGHVVYFTKSK